VTESYTYFYLSHLPCLLVECQLLFDNISLPLLRHPLFIDALPVDRLFKLHNEKVRNAQNGGCERETT
jgi:hypothetical protein